MTNVIQFPKRDQKPPDEPQRVNRFEEWHTYWVEKYGAWNALHIVFMLSGFVLLAVVLAWRIDAGVSQWLQSAFAGLLAFMQSS